MPSRPNKECSHPGCHTVVPGNVARCSKHKLPPRQRTSPESRGYDYKWRKESLQYLKENPFCRECAKAGILTPAKHVDHIIPRSQGGLDDPANYQPLCQSCHNGKTGKETRAARK